MIIREIYFDGYSPVAVLDNGTFDSFDARRFDAMVEDALALVIDIDDDALALADDDDFDDGFGLRIDPNDWTSTAYVGY